jgi:hypothetical protein
MDRAGRIVLLAVKHVQINDRGRGRRVGKSATGRQRGRGPIKSPGPGRGQAPRLVLWREQGAATHRSARRKDPTIAPVQRAGQEEGRVGLRAVLLAVVKNLRRLVGRIAPRLAPRLALGVLPRAGLRLARLPRFGRKRAAADRPGVPGRAAVRQFPGQDLSVAQDGTVGATTILAAGRATVSRVRAEMPDPRQIPLPARVIKHRRVRPLPLDPDP